MSVAYLYTITEVSAELASVIGLHIAEEKRCCHLCLFDKEGGSTTVGFGIATGIRPPAIDINTREYIEDGLSLYSKMYRISLY
jgi:hypothetical protein